MSFVKGRGEFKPLILFADDEEELCELFSYALRDAGLRVLTVTSAEELLDTLEKNKQDPVRVVVTDLDFKRSQEISPRLGLLDGLSLIDLLAEKFPGLAIVALTAHSEFVGQLELLRSSGKIKQFFTKYGSWTQEGMVEQISHIANHGITLGGRPC